MLALTSEALIQSPWLRASPFPVLFCSNPCASHWAGIKSNHCFHCHPNPSNIHPTYRVWCHQTIAGVEQIIQLIGVPQVPQCLWMPLATAVSHIQVTSACPQTCCLQQQCRGQTACAASGFMAGAQICWDFRVNFVKLGTYWSCDIGDSGPWFRGGTIRCISLWFNMFNLSLVHHCLISPYQISVNPPATPIRVDARKQPQNSNRILTVVGCGRFSDSE